MPRQLPLALIAAGLTGCIGTAPEPVPVPPPPEVHGCPELPPPPCAWREPDTAPADLVALEEALDRAWRELAACAENATTARVEWAACPGNHLEMPHDPPDHHP